MLKQFVALIMILHIHKISIYDIIRIINLFNIAHKLTTNRCY